MDDSSDCIIKGNLVKTPSSPIFDSRLVGTVSAVSDNTRHRSLRRPVITSHRKAITPPDNPTENTPPSRAISSQSPSNMPSSLPTILENSESQYIPVNDVSSLHITNCHKTAYDAWSHHPELLHQWNGHGKLLQIWHWYNKLCSVLESPKIGLQPCPHDPCIFHGTLIPGKPPIYVAIYVDDIIFFSVDDAVEQFFHTALSQKIQVEFLGDAEWYIGIKFNWHRFSDATITCCLSQEGYASAIVEEMGLSSANKCPMMTPFRSGFPIDTIPHLDITPDCENAVLDGNDKLA